MSTIPKEPRQVMINLMYLVLTALLALNVSAEILHAFHVVNRGITNSNSAVENKNSQVMSDFNTQLNIQREKTQPFYDKAIVTRTIVADFVKQLDNYKTQIIEQCGGWVDKDGKRHSKPDDPEIANWTPENGDLWDDRNIEVTQRIMVEQGGGIAMEKLINDTRNKLLALFDKDTAKNVFASQLPLRIDGPMKNEEGEQKDWVESNFEMVPTIAALTLLNKYENDANNSEMQILDHLYKSINALDIKVDKMQARVIAPATYIMAGTTYKADILVAAFNSTNHPTVYIGPLNANARKDTTGTYYVKTNLNPVDNGKIIDVEGGIGKYEAMVSQSGLQHYTGAVLIKGPRGEPDYYPFEGDYMGVSATAVVSSDNLNVIYAGIANPFSVSVPGFSSDKVSATISEGSFAKTAPGKFVAILQKTSIG
ncbi:MAG TPA: hypothetical protein VE978_16590, partial [Chitinophagales bacterium]|nr:hypothetical protein [Chitinophagales bacterium]